MLQQERLLKHALLALQRKNHSLTCEVAELQAQSRVSVQQQAAQLADCTEAQRREAEQTLSELQAKLDTQQAACRQLEQQQAKWAAEQTALLAKAEDCDSLHRKCELLATAKEEAELALTRQQAESQIRRDALERQGAQLKQACMELELREMRLQCRLEEAQQAAAADAHVQRQAADEQAQAAARREADLARQMSRLEHAVDRLQQEALSRHKQQADEAQAGDYSSRPASASYDIAGTADRGVKEPAHCPAKSTSTTGHAPVVPADEGSDRLAALEAQLARLQRQAEAAEARCAAAEAARQHSEEAVQVLLAANEKLQMAIISGLPPVVDECQSVSSASTESAACQPAGKAVNCHRRHAQPNSVSGRPRMPRNYRTSTRIVARSREALQSHVCRQTAGRKGAPAPVWGRHGLLERVAHAARMQRAKSVHSRPPAWKSEQDDVPLRPNLEAGSTAAVIQSLQAEYADIYDTYQQVLQQLGDSVGDEEGSTAHESNAALHEQLQEAVEMLEIKASQITILERLGCHDQ